MKNLRANEARDRLPSKTESKNHDNTRRSESSPQSGRRCLKSQILTCVVIAVTDPSVPTACLATDPR